MKELIFSVNGIFDNESANGALSQYDCSRYHIPAYQRGYKWASDTNGAVTVLLDDLREAFQRNIGKRTRRDYYLQYITVKSVEVAVSDRQELCLEVIDGQQRLTTLSVLLSVLGHLQHDRTNSAENKLHYAVRANFFTDHIYHQSGLAELLTAEMTWPEFITKHPDQDSQDVYYLFEAAKKCHSFLLEGKCDLSAFSEFLLSRVKIILNSVEKHVESETVFKNLNSNKVALTQTELIKGWLITKVGRDSDHKRHFKEIIEVRSHIGREWDEMTRWANRADIKSFYFNDRTDGMEALLELTARCLNRKIATDEKTFPLFNVYHKYQDVYGAYKKLRSIFSLLNNWYENDVLYNVIGFCRFSKNGSGNGDLAFLKECLALQTTSELLDHLTIAKNELLKNEDIKALRYDEKEDQPKLHAILLALSVFPALEENPRFDFYRFENENWTLEHVFPQNPEGKGQNLNQKQKELVKEMLGPKKAEELASILAKEVRSKEKKDLLAQTLRGLEHLNSIGNLCLLTHGDNASMGCNFFSDKRTHILKLIQRGSFVPKHTFDLFAKMLPGLTNISTENWSKTDIETHRDYIVSQFKPAEVQS